MFHAGESTTTRARWSMARIAPSKMLPSKDHRATCDVTFRAYEALGEARLRRSSSRAGGPTRRTTMPPSNRRTGRTSGSCWATCATTVPRRWPRSMTSTAASCGCCRTSSCPRSNSSPRCGSVPGRAVATAPRRPRPPPSARMRVSTVGVWLPRDWLDDPCFGYLPERLDRWHAIWRCPRRERVARVIERGPRFRRLRRRLYAKYPRDRGRRRSGTPIRSPFGVTPTRAIEVTPTHVFSW